MWLLHQGSLPGRSAALTMAAAAVAVSAAASLAFAASSYAAPPKPDKKPGLVQRAPGGEVEVLADVMDFDTATQTYILEKNVRVTSAQGTMAADHATVHMTADSGLDNVRARGHVLLDQKRPNGDTIKATGDLGFYSEVQQKARLSGGVTVNFTSATLAEPGLITGAEADIDLKNDRMVITRSSGKQVRTLMKPKGSAPKPGEPLSKPALPIELHADRLESDNQTNTYVATGSPWMVRDNSKISGNKIIFTLDPQTNDLKEARAEGNVVIDVEDETNGTLHATGDTVEFDRATGIMTLTGNVKAVQKPKDGSDPRHLSGKRFIYKTNDRSFRIEGASLRLVPKNPAVKPPAGDR